MKIGILIPEKMPDLRESLKKAAQWGAQGVQFYIKTSHYNLLNATDAELIELKQYIASLGLEIPAVCGELSGHGFQVQAEVPANLAVFEKILHVANLLGTTVVSTHIGVIPKDDNDPTYAIMLAAVTQAGRMAKAYGISIAIETGPELPYVLRRFIEKTDGGIGVNLDPANLVMVHDIDAFTAALEFQGHICHTHAKDGINCQDCDPKVVYDAFAEGGFDALVEKSGEIFKETVLGEGNVNFPRYIKGLTKAGYDGYLTIEQEATPDPDIEIPKSVQFLHTLL